MHVSPISRSRGSHGLQISAPEARNTQGAPCRWPAAIVKHLLRSALAMIRQDYCPFPANP